MARMTFSLHNCFLHSWHGWLLAMDFAWMCGSADLIVRVRVGVWYDMVSHPIASDLIYVNMEMIHLYSVSTVLSVMFQSPSASAGPLDSPCTCLIDGRGLKSGAARFTLMWTSTTVPSNGSVCKLSAWQAKWQYTSANMNGSYVQTHTHTHTLLTALCPGLPGLAGTRKV